MAQWGKNDQSVTANSTTTIETSNGAPIGTWALVRGGQTGTANVSHQTNAHFGNTSPGSRASIDVAMFDNTTPSAFVSGAAVGVFGVSATEMSNNVNNNSHEHPQHAGWNLRIAGTGGIVNVAYTGTATGYTNTDLGVIASPVAGGNGSFTLTTNATGGALVLKITNPGFGFSAVNATPNVSVTAANGAASNGSGATFTAVAGGRAGRIQYQTLVAMGSLGAQTAADGTPALVNDAATDNPEFPGT